MNDIFAHCLEDEWDHIFSILTPEQQNSVLRELRDPNDNSSSLPTTDDAFDFIMKQSNESFHKFAHVLTEQCNKNFSSLLSSEVYVSVFSLRKVITKAPHFVETSCYNEMKSRLEQSRCLELYGLPGSGKSQCAAAYAKEFEQRYPASIIWFFECKDLQHVNDSIISFRQRLVNAKICKNNRSRQEWFTGMVTDIKKSDMHVLLVFEDLYNKQDKVEQLLEALKNYSKGYVLATTRNPGTIQGIDHLHIAGFTDDEALDYLMPIKESFSVEEQHAAREVINSYSNLPLGIAPAKAYCDDKKLSYSEYLMAIDEEIEAMQCIEDFQEAWIDDYYKSESNENVGKNIFATMILALSALKQDTIANRTVSYQELFSHAVFFHHEKIPLHLFRQLLMQPDLLCQEIRQPVSSLLCKVAITNLRDQLRESSLAVIEPDPKNPDDVFASTISTHRVVLTALKHLHERNHQRSGDMRQFKLLNALHALTCCFQKDNRLRYQHDLLILLMPHVVSTLAKVEKLIPQNQDPSAKMLERILVIRLLELKGFACTQSDAMSEAAEPLKEAYDRLIKLLCDSANVKVDSIEAMANERKGEGNDSDRLATKASIFYHYCVEAVRRIPDQVFTHLVQTVGVNEEDLVLLQRNNENQRLHKSIQPNQPLSADAFEWLRARDLALSEEKMKKIYLAEMLASIAYTRGRLMFYGGFEGDRTKHVEYLKLALYITQEVFRDTDVKLIHHLLTNTNGLLYLELDKNTEDSYKAVFSKYKMYLDLKSKYYEHGVLKEDGATPYFQMRCYRQMIKANNGIMKLGVEKDPTWFKVCRQLQEVVHNHPEYARTAVDGLLTAGRFCAEGEEHQLAMEIFREVMDRVNNEEDRYKLAFIEATTKFCHSALKISLRANLEEAKQRCEKASVLLPRSGSTHTEDMRRLGELIDKALLKRKRDDSR